MSEFVLCLTLNPCLDKTLTVPDWQPGDNVRGLAIREVVGGKGNNVARALNGLGELARPLTFFGGATGSLCNQLLREADGLEPIAISSTAETRTILTVRTGETSTQTAFFDPDPAITEAEASLLLNVTETLLISGKVRAITLSGSSPSPVTHNVYGDCVRIAQTHGIPVLVDTYGPALHYLGDAVPDVLQLNLKEIAELLGKNQESLSDTEIFQWLSRWIGQGTKLAVVTRGPDSILAATSGGFFELAPPRLEVINPIGSGDCFMAGLAFGLIHNMTTADHLQFAAACAVANAMVWDAGAITMESTNQAMQTWLQATRVIRRSIES